MLFLAYGDWILLPVNIFAMACRFRWRIIKAFSGSDYVLFFLPSVNLVGNNSTSFLWSNSTDSKILKEKTEEIPLLDLIREGTEMKIIHRRWDSKYFITILCFMLVLMINIHLLMNKKGALADYLFDSPVVSSQIDSFFNSREDKQSKILK